MAPRAQPPLERLRSAAIRTRSWTAGALVAGAALGCNAILGFEEGTPPPSPAAGGAAGTGAGGGAVGTESCVDNVDNTGDGWVDCDDPQCQATHQCAPLPPEGWSGVGWLYEGAAAPPCAEPSRTMLYEATDLMAPAASCACACGSPDPSCRATAMCAGTCQSVPYVSTVVTDACVELDVGTSASRRCWAASLTTASLGCAPESALDAPATLWDPIGLFCAAADVGACSGGESCVPRPPPGAEGPCVSRAGEHPCPPPFPALRSYWDGTLDDTRRCSATGCTCGAPSGASCGCTGAPCGVEVSTGPGCSVATNVAEIDGDACVSTLALSGTGPFYASFRLGNVGVTAAGSCVPSGASSLSGTIAPAAAVTICCAAGSGG